MDLAFVVLSNGTTARDHRSSRASISKSGRGHAPAFAGSAWVRRQGRGLMIGVSIALLISFLLLLLLGVWRQAAVTARELPPQGDLLPQGVDLPLEPCPAEYVAKIFSRDDWDFVATMKSPSLKRFFL